MPKNRRGAGICARDLADLRRALAEHPEVRGRTAAFVAAGPEGAELDALTQDGSAVSYTP